MQEESIQGRRRDEGREEQDGMRTSDVPTDVCYSRKEWFSAEENGCRDAQSDE